MKTLVAFLALSSIVASDARSQSANAAYFELGGSAIVPSINYERRLSDAWYGRAGLSWVTGETTEDTETTFVVPLTASHLNRPDSNHHLELGGGVTLVTGDSQDLWESVDDDETVSNAFVTGIVGYRYQKPEGGPVPRRAHPRGGIGRARAVVRRELRLRLVSTSGGGTLKVRELGLRIVAHRARIVAPFGLEQAMRAIHSILRGGALAGALDIAAAFAIGAGFGSSPERVLQGISTGLLGPSAFDGGAATAALGLLCHFVIALSAAAIYVAASRALPLLVTRPVASGAAYGVVVYGVMAFVVVPLSKASPRSTNPGVVLTMIVVHIVCVGLPIALAAARPEARPATVAAVS